MASTGIDRTQVLPGAEQPCPAGRPTVVLGAGYAGLSAALALGRALRDNPAHRVVLVDRNDFHELKPKIPDAVGEWTDCSVQVPLADVLEPAGVSFFQASVTGLDPVGREVLTDAGPVPYWRLVVALGAEPDFAPSGQVLPGVREFAVAPYGQGAACRLRHQLRARVEHAGTLPSRSARQPFLTVVIAGGGFVGVEMAGELADRLAELTRRCGISPREARVVLLEPQARLLGFGPEMDVAALESLLDRGVDVRLGVALAGAEPGLARLDDGTTIATETLVWAGGLRGTTTAASLGIPTDDLGRILVDTSLRVIGPPAIYAIGDGARCGLLDHQPALVSSGQAAVEQADVVARAIVAEIRNDPAPVYDPHAHGVVVLVGRRAAVARLGERLAPRWMGPWLKQLPTLRHAWRLGGPRLALRAWGSTLLPLIAPERVDRYTLAGDAPSHA